MGERVLVEQVRLIEQEDRVLPRFPSIRDVHAHGVEEGYGGGRGRQAQGGAELAVEVAAPEGGVVAVGEHNPARAATRSTHVLCPCRARPPTAPRRAWRASPCNSTPSRGPASVAARSAAAVST